MSTNFDPLEHEAMRLEWEAWRVVCQQLEHRFIDLNNEGHEALHAALVRWGEEMGVLRGLQDLDDRLKWLEESRKNAPVYEGEKRDE